MATQEQVYLGSPDNPRTAAVVCYITLIGWLIAYFALYNHDKNSFSAFHLRQTLLLHIIAFIMNLLSFLALWHLFPFIIVVILALGLLVLWLMGVFNAVSSKAQPVPLVGELAQQLFRNI